MTPEAIATLLAERMHLQVDTGLAANLSRYLELLEKWNGRTNLTAVRDAESMVLRHFGESLQCARALPPGIGSLLDYGSGGGFPGAIISLACSSIQVTLAESQNKKAAFLQELCRAVPVPAKVHAARVEDLPAGKRFDAVTLRAVDRMEEACAAAMSRVMPGGWLVLMATRASLSGIAPKLSHVAWKPSIPLVGSEQGVIAVARVLAG